ncbi:GGDEF domain-containing protein [Kamptonema formosum]|uniref:GGDEF domain-containing protein n=1 Tax=Kamptonema formosum TaxID=331992 RepID=UPI0008FC13F2|nr:GGDEF domain-containing protein [Oscillatoria sp. PCC 10802]
MAVIMLDVDHFKRFNDTFGHAAGDTVLRQVGQLLQKHVRSSDIACRYGGEEFALILPETPLEVARQQAELLRQAIKQLNIQHRQMPLGAMTASFGVAIFPEHALTGAAAIQAADAALYRAKAQGRDRVAIAVG